MRPLPDLAPRDAPPPAGTRVVMDLRPLQEPERTPITASYLERLLEAYAARPLEGESFVALLRGLRPDPTVALEESGLAVASRRWLPPTSALFRSAGLTIDSFLLRGAEVGSARDVGRGGSDGPAAPIGAVYHTAGGAVPLGSRLPVVATLLDLAPWELPQLYARSHAARFGHRVRLRVLHDAARVIVTSRSMRESARKLLHLPVERIAVVPLAAGEPFGAWAMPGTELAALRARFDIPPRYFVFAGRYDARKDMTTLFGALRALREEAAPTPAGASSEASAGMPWPPVLVLAGAPGAVDSDEPALARAAERHGVRDLVRLTPRLESRELALLQSGARAFVFPALSEGTGLPVLEALAVGVPVIASRVGPLAEIVGTAGIIVEPRDEPRLAAALRTLWSDDRLHLHLARIAQDRARGPHRTWHDVARETRAVYAAAARGG